MMRRLPRTDSWLLGLGSERGAANNKKFNTFDARMPTSYAGVGGIV